MKEGGGFPQSKLLRYREITTSQTKIWILQRGRPPENMFPPAETVFLLAENMFPLPETALPLPGQQGAATLVRPRTRTQNQKFVRVISVLQRFFVPGPPEVKTQIRLGVGGTKKTKNRSAAKGSHNSANSRKIHEKNEKSDLRKRKPEQHKFTKNPRKKTKNRTTVKGRQSSANPRKIHEKKQTFCPSKRSTPMGRKINATNPGPRKILEETKKTKIFRFLRKIHEKSHSQEAKRTKNELSCQRI